ncbi:MAG: response regulator [Marinicaulis sp.]|nr:response regulator [Marinicaulis sp.]
MNALGNDISESNNNTIIIVDDDEAVRDSLSILLSLAGYAVNALKSGADLLVLLETKKSAQQPDCLILDVHMPHMSGLDLVETLNAKACKIPIILISGNIDIATRARAKQLGISRLLEKPFSDELLFENIRKMIG